MRDKQKISSKKQLEMALSRLKGFSEPDFGLEQYPTEAGIAAEIAWNAYYRREIQGKVAADLGCGTGILGLSAIMMGAEKVFFVDIDEKALDICRENINIIEDLFQENLGERCITVNKKAQDFDDKVDAVIQNPPFGIQSRTHSDKEFLEKAFSVADTIYSFHKAESRNFINAICKDNGFSAEEYWEFDWPLKRTMRYHKKNIQYIKVGCWRMKKISKADRRRTKERYRENQDA